ncbi:MAG: hypothetical protein AAB534_01935 [Patescibacteria group bacterium]
MKIDFYIPPGLEHLFGDSVHTSRDPRPHITGSRDGEKVHVPVIGQTTIPMFEQGGHRLGEVKRLSERFPDVFRDSGFVKPL